jgi:hypothetical protein
MAQLLAQTSQGIAQAAAFLVFKTIATEVVSSSARMVPPATANSQRASELRRARTIRLRQI